MSAALCLIAAYIFETVGYPSNTVHWLSLYTRQRKIFHCCWHDELSTQTTTDMFQTVAIFRPVQNRSLKALFHFFMIFILLGAHNQSFYERVLGWMWPGDNFDVFCVFSRKATYSLQLKKALLFHQAVQKHYSGEVEK